MKNLLYLVHRIPYPPNKGDKISSFNLLRHLAGHYRVFLGTFIDDPADRAYTDKVREYCADACFADLDSRWAKIASLRGLLTGEALTLTYYRSRGLKAWVDRVCNDQPPDAVLIYSGAMGQYVPPGLPQKTTTLFEMEDVDSDKWRSYAHTKPWPLNWIYARESRKLLAYERKMAAHFDVSVFISPDEAELFRTLAPEVAGRVTHRTQGVDSDYFRPGLDLPNPYPEDRRVLVFCGAMDYWPNADAVTWYVNEVLPGVVQHAPDVLFAIVGMNPTAEVRNLAERDEVLVTGAVPDVRPYVMYAHAAVLPLRIARGIQNKALEAMALEKPLVATPGALTGIVACPEFQPWVGETAPELLAATKSMLDAAMQGDPGGRACVLRHYNWESNLNRMERMLEAGRVVEE